MRHILSFPNYGAILTMTVIACNYSSSFPGNLKKKKKEQSRLTSYSSVSKIVISLGVKASLSPRPRLDCLLDCPHDPASSPQRSFLTVHRQRLHVFFASVATASEPPVPRRDECVPLRAVFVSAAIREPLQIPLGEQQKLNDNIFRNHLPKGFKSASRENNEHASKVY